MKTTLKMVIFSLIATVLFLVPNVCKADVTTVADEDSLKEALANNAVISLEDDITLTGPIEITNSITINGNGHTIKGAEGFTSTTANKSLFTASNGGSLTLTNVKLANSPKYGVQAYVGGTVTLNGVTISNCAYGAVLVNGGTLDVKSVTFGSNGNNTGIEVSTSKGAAGQNAVPKIIMDGEIKAGDDCNIFYLATDENDATTKVQIENNSSEQKILFTEDGSIVLADSENNLVFKSNAKDTLQVIGETEVYTPNAPKAEAKEKDSTPKTGSVNYVAITLSIMAIAGSAVLVMKKL